MSFDPATLSLASAGVSMFGSLLGGASNAASSEYNAAIARQNAIIAQQQGQAAIEAQQRDAARKMGTMIANYGASGVQVDSGSPVDVLADSAGMAELDKLTLKYNYQLKAMGYDQQANLADMNAQSSRTSSILNAGSTALKGYSMYKYMGGGGGTTIPGFGSSGAAAGDAVLWDGAGSSGGLEALAALA